MFSPAFSLLGSTPADLARGRPYAERSDQEAPWHDRLAESLLSRAVAPLRRQVSELTGAGRAVVADVQRHEGALANCTDAALRERFLALRVALRRAGFARPLVGECFAIVREASARAVGQRHFDTQLMAGWSLLNGCLIEMATGEGKTLAATLPACVVSLAGHPAHVITVNDYLASRDAHEMGPLYRFLGLSVGVVVQGMSREARRAAYACPVTYCTNKELAFDYLRDRVAAGDGGSRLHLLLDRLEGRASRDEGIVLRGLHFGIVDEADSAFIDEARTPLILSAPATSAQGRERCEQALQLAGRLVAGEHYRVDARERNVELSTAGSAEIERVASALGPGWRSRRSNEESVLQALRALCLYQPDHHYLVSDGRIQIVDESTGRVMPDRAWERGLHQMIEAKEGCELTDARETLARITYQRMFRRYLRLAGMTGTGVEVAPECRRIYGLDVRRVPLHRPCRRRMRSVRCVPTQDEKWQSVADAVERVAHGEGRPVLIGTRSVRASEALSAVLAQRGIAHVVLNAKQDRAESEIVAAAGQPARVTVATNMAGRGTDIKLAPQVAERGGLHVILAEYNDSRRIDRQLFGRCARQGDAGSCEAVVALDDELFRVHAGRLAAWLARRGAGATTPEWIVRCLVRWAQFGAERQHGYVRALNLEQDRRLARMLAFSGRGE